MSLGLAIISIYCRNTLESYSVEKAGTMYESAIAIWSTPEDHRGVFLHILTYWGGQSLPFVFT